MKQEQIITIPKFSLEIQNKISKVQFETAIFEKNTGLLNLETRDNYCYREDLGNNINLELMFIPDGTFFIGSPVTEKGRWNAENPQTKVTLKPFFLGKYPITQAQWKQVASLPKISREIEEKPSHFKGDSLPVENINWNEAVEFCQRLSHLTNKNYSLPSEAQWEYACRGFNLPKEITLQEWNEKYCTPFYFGETINPDLVNYYSENMPEKLINQTSKVGSYPPNKFGLYDMHGNIYEWCADIWHYNYHQIPQDGSPWLDNSHEHYYSLRGGAWCCKDKGCRSAYRNTAHKDRDHRANIYGLRIVLSIT